MIRLQIQNSLETGFNYLGKDLQVTMKEKLLVALFLAPVISFSQVWYPLPQADSVTITYRDLTVKTKNKRINGRIQIRTLPDATWILANNFDRLPKSFSRFTLQSKDKRYKFRRNQMLPAVQHALNTSVSKLLEDTLFFADAQRKNKLLQSYPKDRDQFFAGAKGGLFFTHNWIPLYTLPNTLPQPVTLKISRRFTNQETYHTDRLPVSHAWRLPVLDNNDCGDFDRFKELRKMNGYGIDKIKYSAYLIPDRQAIRQNFEIYFEKNRADARPESVQPVIDFLEKNSYSILRANIEGYSSLEGTEEANERLQRKRAGILIKTLRAYNNEPISSDTVIIAHGYEMFRQAIRETKYQWLDTLSNEALRLALNSDAGLLNAVEPYLKNQRKSSLELVLAKRLTREEIFDRFKRDFMYWEARLLPQNNQPVAAQAEPRVMGMLAYLFDLMLSEQISELEFNQVVHEAKNKNLLQILLAYHEIIRVEKRSITDSVAWNNHVKSGGFANVILGGHSGLIELIANARMQGNDLKKYKAQLVDIQYYLFDYVRNGWIGLGKLCVVDYPNSSNFGGYKLRQLAFLKEMAKTTEVPCEHFTWAKAERPKPYTDSWLDESVPGKNFSGAVMLVNGRYLPNYGPAVYSPFMFYIKRLFLTKDKGLSQYVVSSDNLYQFDLYTLASYNVSEWKPEQNFFQDREVLLEDMNKLIMMLKRIDHRICRPQVNELYLDYHLKALHYLTVYYEPGNPKHTEIVQQSLAFISNYYSTRAARVPPRLSLYLLHQLNAFYALPGQHEATRYAWTLLKSIKIKRNLSPAEEVLLEKYNRYYSVAVGKK